MGLGNGKHTSFYTSIPTIIVTVWLLSLRTNGLVAALRAWHAATTGDRAVRPLLGEAFPHELSPESLSCSLNSETCH